MVISLACRNRIVRAKELHASWTEVCGLIHTFPFPGSNINQDMLSLAAFLKELKLPK